jgi:hypothetical protein
MTATVTFEASRVLITMGSDATLVLSYAQYRNALKAGKGLRRAQRLEQRLTASASREEGKTDRAGVVRLSEYRQGKTVAHFQTHDERIEEIYVGARHTL